MSTFDAKVRKPLKHGTAPIAAMLGYAACYVIGPNQDGPVKVGVATDVTKRFSSLQTSTWVKLWIFDLIWFPGHPVAFRVEAESMRRLKGLGHHLRGEWFAVSADIAAATNRESADALGLKFFDEEERRRRVNGKAQADFDALVNWARRK